MKLKIKEKYQKYKELKKDPRKKALMQIGLWIVGFFLFYVIVIVIMPHPTPNYHTSTNDVKSDSELYQDMENFEYSATLSYQGMEESLEGIYFQNQYNFSYLGKKYTSFDGKVFEIDDTEKLLKETKDERLLLPTVELSKENLSNWLKTAEKGESITYKDGTQITHYQFEDIPFILTSEKGSILKVEADFTTYFAHKGISYDSFKVTIEYRKINDITSYSANYSDYLVVEEEEYVNN